MKKFLIAIVMALASTAVMADVGIASGAPTGTNYPMAEDIVRVCSTPKNKIHNVVSEGSMDNIFKIYGDKNTQYGIIQTDALAYQQGIDPKMMDRIEMVFPFFSADMHLVVRADSKINSLADLAGKQVIEGPEGSGTWVSVQVIKGLTGIKWTSLKASQQAGLNAVVAGQADAEFIVAGRPIDMLSKVQKGIKLISLSHPKLDSFGLYTKTMIASGSYPFQTTGVSTYKVDTILATYAFKNQFQAEIGGLVSCIAHNLPTLASTGHPKWKDVDPLDINRIKWQAHPAAVAAIQREGRHK
jgi:TRAP transporter TAXI family solute receptor